MIWEGVLRLAGGGLLAWFGLVAGLQSAVAGTFDFTVGVIYLFWLPRHLGVSLLDLLLDKSMAQQG